MTSIAFLLFPLVTFVLFARMRAAQALIWSVMLGYMFLPEGAQIALPGIPDLDKTSVPAMSLVAALVVIGGKIGHGERRHGGVPAPVEGSRLFGRLLAGLVAMLVLSATLGVLANLDTVRFGPRVIQGLKPWDTVNQIARTVFLLVPFFLARRYLATPQAHRQLMIALVIAGLGYSFLMLAEIRLSPQLHNWVYGYHQHSFRQHVRDGFRPMVFLSHGLEVGIFTFMTAVAAFCLWRAKGDARRGRWLAAGLWLTAILVLSENLGAVILAILFVPVLILPLRWQLRAAAIVILPLLVYPAIRQAGMLPVYHAVDVIETISVDRAQSFAFRLENEDALLARASERPLLGWGGWGRNRVYDPETGEDISTTDGLWIIVLGNDGWFGYIAFFGLLVLPVLALSGAARRKPLTPETVGLGIILAGNMVYMIPNAFLGPVAWLAAGALAGFVQFDEARVPEARSAAQARPGQGRKADRLPNTRFGADTVPRRAGDVR